MLCPGALAGPGRGPPPVRLASGVRSRLEQRGELAQVVSLAERDAALAEDVVGGHQVKVEMG